MAYLPLRTDDDDLIPLLRSASTDDLGILVEFIMKSITSQLDSCPQFENYNPRAHENPPIHDGDHRIYVDEISAEIQKYGGNTGTNILFRGGKGVKYSEIVRDVADKLKVKYNDAEDVASIEIQIQLKVLKEAYEKMDDQQRRALLDAVGAEHNGAIPAILPVMAIQASLRLGGFAAYQMAIIVANAVARQLLGHGLQLAANAGLVRALGVLAGPIGWAITVLWTIFDLAGPAYRVTIPCVLQITYIRQKSLISTCPRCGSANPKTAKFCQFCGKNQI